MNIVSCDPSIISTSVVVNGKIFNYCRESAVYTKNGMSKWYRYADEFVNYRFIKINEFSSYSEGEITKIRDYDFITDLILQDILDNIDLNEETIFTSEGYNFASTAGDIIDLVAFSTILRKKIYDRVTKNILIVSPSTLKLESCKLTYSPIVKESGKRIKKITHEWRNSIGIPGGKFTKVDMCRSIIENESIDHPWYDHLKSIKDEILSFKDIKKPYEDVNDAIILYYVVKFGNLKP